jgi:VanZ family protein
MNSSFRNKQIYRAAQWIWAAFIFVLHIAPVDTDGVSRFDFPFADKWIHGILFFLLAALSYMVRNPKHRFRITLLLIILPCACYGATLEWIQASFTDERSGDVFDWLADMAGVMIGIGAAHLLEPLLTRRS